MTDDAAILAAICIYAAGCAAICIYAAGCAAIGATAWLCRHNRRRDAGDTPLPCRYIQAHDWP